MQMLDIIYPGVFEIDTLPGRNKSFTLKFISPNFKIPVKTYGVMPNLVNYYWKSFKRHKLIDGLILTGLAGAGKTLLADILGNLGISIGLRVVTVTNIRYSPELMRYLESLERVILIFDEFAKVFPMHEQQKILTLLSNILGRERIVIITENYRSSISPHILDRPGRLRYGKHFEKLDSQAVIEYTNEFNVKGEFLDDLMKLYSSSLDFTFDHLIAIVSEHLDEPTLSLEELLGYLNLDKFTIQKILTLDNITCNNEDYTIVIEECTYSPDDVTMKRLDDFITITLFVNGYNKKSKEHEKEPVKSQLLKQLMLNRRNIVELIDDKVTFETEGFRVSFILMYEDEVPKKTAVINNGHNLNNTNGTPYRGLFKGI